MTAIKSLIGHLKHAHRIKESYLWNRSSSTVYVLLVRLLETSKKLMWELTDKYRKALLCLWKLYIGKVTYNCIYIVGLIKCF